MIIKTLKTLWNTLKTAFFARFLRVHHIFSPYVKTTVINTHTPHETFLERTIAAHNCD